jgi:hypothetical protein
MVKKIPAAIQESLKCWHEYIAEIQTTTMFTSELFDRSDKNISPLKSNFQGHSGRARGLIKSN